MRRIIVIAAFVTIFLLAIVVWVWDRISSQDLRLKVHSVYKDSRIIRESDPEYGEIWSGISERNLVFCSNANVPLKFLFGKGNKTLEDYLGFPKYFRPFNVNVMRIPCKNEWNIALVNLGKLGPGKVIFLTKYDRKSPDGTWMHSVVFRKGEYICATRDIQKKQDVCSISYPHRNISPIFPSERIDRMPSVSNELECILFHSFRDGNPGGDLYLAKNRIYGNREIIFKDLVRLTNNPDVEYAWPKISSCGTSCIAVERPLGQQIGRVIRWEIEADSLINPEYLTDELEYVKFPSIDSKTGVACWEIVKDEKHRIVLWREEGEALILDIPPSIAGSSPDFIQPFLSPDGKWIVFIEDPEVPFSDKIGFYNVESKATVYLEGCGGSFMFPSLSEK